MRSICFSPDSKCLYTASDDGFIHIYDVNSKQLIDSLSGHNSWVLSIAASPDGNSLVSGSADNLHVVGRLHANAPKSIKVTTTQFGE